MLLSIGMIVKNEEKYLDECLTALKPILENIDSELIIADTGSTDRTFEIAKKYTDNLYHFEWCNDFAKARNSTIKHSTGKWYMYIDADEILENAEEIINFFNSGEFKHYNGAKFKLINYSGKNKEYTADIYLCRMFKRSPNMLFKGIIHEIIDLPSNIKILPMTCFKHYGYVFNTEKDAIKKAKRNIELLNKLLTTNPESPVVRNQLADSYNMLGDNIKVIKYSLEGLKLCKYSDKLPVTYALLANLIIAHFKNNSYNKAIEYSKKYLSICNSTVQTHIDVYYILASAYFFTFDNVNSIEYAQKYIRLYKKMKKQELLTIDTNARAILFNNMSCRNEILKIIINIYIKEEKFSEARKIYEENNYFINCDNLNNIFEYTTIYLNILDKTNSINSLCNFYKMVVKNQNDEVNEKIISAIENYIQDNIDSKNKIISILNNLEIKNKYTQYMSIRYSFINNNENAVNNLINFINNTEKIDKNYFDLIYFIIKNNIPLSIIINKISIDDFINCINILCKLYDDFKNYVCDYINNNKHIDDYYLEFILYEKLLCNLCVDDKEIVLKIYKKYLNCCTKYINYIYKDIVLSEDYLHLLPKNIQTAFYFLECEKFKDINNKSKYINYLRKILFANNDMKNLISILSNNINDEFKSLSEFELLALQIRKNIQMLIDSNNYNEAKEILNEYKQINPNDIAINKFEKILN